MTINGAASGGEPGAAHCTLTVPSSFSAPGVIDLEAPEGAGSCPQLAAETTYFVVIEWISPSGTDYFAVIPQTYSTRESAATDEDPGGAEGWSIADHSYYLTASSGVRTWTAYEDVASFKIQVRGAAANSPATGAPTVSGTARVGETLTASTSGIADEDGLDDPDFNYQWVANDGSVDADIVDATNETYKISDDDAGKTIKVRVSFEDDDNNEESLTSEPTVAVAATVPGAPEHLTVSPHDAGALDLSWQAPESNGGSPVTGYKVQYRRRRAAGTRRLRCPRDRCRHRPHPERADRRRGVHAAGGRRQRRGRRSAVVGGVGDARAGGCGGMDGDAERGHQGRWHGLLAMGQPRARCPVGHRFRGGRLDLCGALRRALEW